MPYASTASYTPEAMKALGRNPSNRRDAAGKLITAGGGKLLSFYRTLGDGLGVHIIFDADPTTAGAICAVAVSGGALNDVKFIRLWTGDEVSALRRKRAEIEKSYAPPG